MPGLPFQPLQAQPDQSFASAAVQAQPTQPQQMQPQVPEVPKSTPGLILENDLRQKLQYIEYLENQLVARKLPPAEHDAEVLKLKSAVDESVYEFAAKQRKLRETQQLIDLGVLDSQKGEQALWNMVLPQEAAAAQPSLKVADDGAPFSPNQVVGMGEKILEFAGAAPRTPQLWTKAVNEPRTQEDLITQYNAWKTFIGYAGLNVTRQKQVDNEWDSVMKAHPKWNWNPQAVEKDRPQGPLKGAYLGKPSLGSSNSNPISESIRKQVDKKLTAQTQKHADPLGLGI